MNITEMTDDEILAIANPYWSHLIKASNDGKYGEFVRHFSHDLLRGLNEVEVGKQFANSDLTRNLSESVEFIGSPMASSVHGMCVTASGSTDCTIMKIDSTNIRTSSSAVIASTKPGQIDPAMR